MALFAGFYFRINVDNYHCDERTFLFLLAQ